jgi:1,4-dihydroxy-2-naphthoyl-CoA hydrolase
MPIWVTPFTLDDLKAIGRGTTDEHVGMQITAFGDDWLEGTVPLDERTRSECGELHPGALGILAEALGSIAANMCVDQSRQYCLGQILQLHHPVPVRRGPLCGRASPLLITSASQLWQIEIRDGTGARVSVADLTMIVLQRDAAAQSGGARPADAPVNAAPRGR